LGLHTCSLGIAHLLAWDCTPARLGLHTCSLGIAKSQAFRTCPHTCSLGITHLLAWDYTPARLGLPNPKHFRRI